MQAEADRRISLSELLTLAEVVAALERPEADSSASRHALPDVSSKPPRELPSAPPAPVVRPIPAQAPIAQTHRELEEARSAGYREGWEAALQQEVEPLHAQAQQESAALHTLVKSIGDRLERLSVELERDAFRFALAVAGRIVRGAVQEDREVIIRQVREAVRRVVGVDSIILRINPADEPVVRDQREGILTSADSIRQLVIETDEAIERGGCIIETGSGTIDARIATQLKQIEATLFGSPGSAQSP